MAGGPGSYVFGAEEKKELMDVIENASLFRYGTPGVDGFQGKVATFEKEIAEQLGHKYVVATSSGTGSLMCCLAALGIGMGDEVIVPAPYFLEYGHYVGNYGGVIVPVPSKAEEGFMPDLEGIAKAITPKTKAMILNNPNNPTGALYPREVLEGIVNIARRHQLILFSDEIYDRLVMDGLKHISTASLAPDLFCVTFSGLSKSHMVCGFRVGWMILSGNKDIARDYIAGINMLSNMRLCSNVPGQSIIQTALGGYQSVNEYIVPGGRVYEQRDYIYKAFCLIAKYPAVHRRCS